MYSYHVQYRPGADNVAPDALSRVCGAFGQPSDLKELHESLGHPGVSRLAHFIRSKPLPFSMDEIRQLCAEWSKCSAVKPRFYRPPQSNLIKATQPWERVSIDFKGPLPNSSRHHQYLLMEIDEYSRFPFVFVCSDTSASSVIKCLCSLFSLVGFPSFVHSDRGSAFMSKELKIIFTGEE